MAPEVDPTDATMFGDAEAGPVRSRESATPGLYAGRYQIEREVGRGGMGTVYRALDVMVGDVVALKILDAGATPTVDQLEWFRREVRLARRITHPNVARTHDMGEQGGTHYITMELVEGTTLHALLGARPRADDDDDVQAPRRRLEPGQAVRIAIAVCDGLAAAHAAGVVHRDLKPANVLIDHGGRVVLTDFGIARALSEEQAGARTQGVVGTPLYMAPEQLSGTPVDARADLYALGLMLFEMLTGVLPFAGKNPLAAALARLTEAAPDPRSVHPGLAAPICALVLECLAREPGARPASATAVAERMRAWLIADAPEPGHTLSEVADATPTPGTIGPGRTLSRPLRPVLLTQRALAVLPFRHVGPADQSYLGEALTDELIDVLSRTRGLRVLGSGATSKYRTDRDPRAVGADLGVDAVVDATVHSSATQVRVAVRLVEVETGTQLWSERFDSGLGDLFELQDRICKQIAEALRVELDSSADMTHASAEAVALYLRGRRKLISFRILGPDAGIDLLEQCLRLAPDLQPAIACHAIACVRAWFAPQSSERDLDPRDWEAEAKASVARALERAPDLAETHLARAMLAVQLGEGRVAVQALLRALDIAPTYAHAHQYLAQLQCEAGNAKEGMERARLAFALEPQLIPAMLDVARLQALRGDREGCAESLAAIDRSAPQRTPAMHFRIRMATWFGQYDEVRALVAIAEREEVGGFARFILGFARTVLGELSRAELDAAAEDLIARAASPRSFTLMSQLCTEMYAVSGDPQTALSYYLRAADSVLIDIEWSDRCPLLTAMRALPGYAAGRQKLRKRVQAMWDL